MELNNDKQKTEELTELQKRIITLMRGKIYITIAEITAAIDISETIIRENIKLLIEKDIVARKGPNKAGYWKVKIK